MKRRTMRLVELAQRSSRNVTFDEEGFDEEDIFYDSSPPPSVEYSWDLEFSDSTCDLEVSTQREENLEPEDNLTLIHNRNESQSNGKDTGPENDVLERDILYNDPNPVNQSVCSTTSDHNPEQFYSPRSNRKQKKKTICKFCNMEVTNFERHLERNHTDSKEVQDLLQYPKKSIERRNLLSLIRNAGHFTEFLKGNVLPKYNFNTENKVYYPCARCKALLTKAYLARHKRSCILKNEKSINLDNNSREASVSQTLIASSLDYNNTLHKLLLKDKVFSRMKADEISLVVKKDYLICAFGENYLKKHKREQLTSVCSNKMRELARLLIAFRKMTNNSECNLKDILKPSLFDIVIECAKQVGGYDPDKKSYRSPSLSAHLGTSLKQVCELMSRFLLKEDKALSNSETRNDILKETKRFKELIDTQWTTEISSLAFKDLQEKQWEKPNILPLTRDIAKFKEYVISVANKAVACLKDDRTNKNELRNLIEASLILTILFNRKRIGDVQYTKLSTYTEHISTNNLEECENALSESEKVLTKYYKRIVTGGKGSRPVAILFPKNLQNFIDFFIKNRLETKLVPQNNPYLFGCPGTIKWTRGDVVIRKFARNAGLEFPNQISSNKLRKQIATVMQILNLNKEETQQFAQFMGHTVKTHNEFYKLPQDVYETAKISKLLLLMEKGANKYKGKSLSEINIDPHSEKAEENSDHEESEPMEASRSTQNELVSKVPIGHPIKPGMGRTPWTEDQIRIVKSHFKNNIREKKPPKKHECVKLLEKFPDILHNKDWVRVKTFIYNCYRSK